MSYTACRDFSWLTGKIKSAVQMKFAIAFSKCFFIVTNNLSAPKLP